MPRRSDARSFVDQNAKSWVVTKYGFASFGVSPNPRPLQKLHDVARSCAKKLNVTTASDGTPLDYVNEHSRIWNRIWKLGIDAN